MKITLQLPDDLYEAYERHLPKALSGQATTEDLIVAQLDRFKDVSPQDRAVVLHGKARVRLEAILSGGTISSGDDLLQKVERLASIEVGEVKVPFTPGELQNIRTYATKNRIPFEEAMKRVVYGMKEQFGLYVG